MRGALVATVAAGLLQCHAYSGEPRHHSALWGIDGEKWDPRGRLPDFSYAGYRMGERAIPDVPAKANVRAFGAKGDGKADDTAAFKEAISRTNGGAILVPPGRYVITDFLEIRKSGVVLRGAGPDETTLFFPKYLNDIKPNWGATTGGRRTSNYSWSGGFVSIRSSFGRKRLARIVEHAKRGDRVVVVDKPPGVRPGDFIDIRQRDEKENTLAHHVYCGQPGDVAKLNGSSKTSHVTRVTAVRGTRVAIERALRTDVDPKWQAEVFEFRPGVTESGIESLTFEFPNVPYGGHFTELGYNPVAIYGAAHCWVRNVRIVNADSGPMVGGRFCTLTGIVYESERKPDRGGCIGHHGIYLQRDDNLFEDFDVRGRFIHDVTVSHCAGNVSRRGKGADLCFDHHKRAPYANLFTDIDIGRGARMYRCGGGAALGRNSAGWETFWNVRAAKPQSWPSSRFGPDLMNFVGVVTGQPSVTDPDGRWWEAIPPAALHPPDLYEAQLARRLGRPRGRKGGSASRTKAPGVAPRPPVPRTSPARPRVREGALARWDARLKKRARAAVEGGRTPVVHLPSAGPTGGRMRLRSADDERIRLSGGGLQASFEWEKLTLQERRSLASALARGGSSEDAALAALYLLALGDREAAERYLAKLPADLAAEVRSSVR